MNFDSREDYKIWLKTNGYDTEDANNLSINWDSVSIIDGQLTVSSQNQTSNDIETPNN